MNIINKITNALKGKVYAVDFTTDKENVNKNWEWINKIITLPDNNIRARDVIVEYTPKFENFHLVFRTKKEQEMFVNGAKRYIDYRIMTITN